MATHELVVGMIDDTLAFPISEEQATAIAITGVTAIKETLSAKIVFELGELYIESLAIRDVDVDCMVWVYDAVKFGHPINEVYSTASESKVTSVYDAIKQLVTHYERFHFSERPVIGADITDTTNRVESQLKQLIFDMYEHEHAVAPEVPEPPQQDNLYDCNGTFVGDLKFNYNKSQPKHSLKDYLNNGWTREQLLKEKLFLVAPAPPCMPTTAPTAPVEQLKPKELAISKLLLDLKDNNLPESVRILVKLLANLKK